jgi:hypothetical protein
MVPVATLDLFSRRRISVRIVAAKVAGRCVQANNHCTYHHPTTIITTSAAAAAASASCTQAYLFRSARKVLRACTRNGSRARAVASREEAKMKKARCVFVHMCLTHTRGCGRSPLLCVFNARGVCIASEVRAAPPLTISAQARIAISRTHGRGAVVAAGMDAVKVSLFCCRAACGYARIIHDELIIISFIDSLHNRFLHELTHQ